jgi:hypothetical protein
MREPDSGKCETWAAFATCQQAFHACSDVGRKLSPKGMARWSILRLALKRERALFPVEEAETHADMPHPEMRDMEEVNVDGEFESRLKWLNRDSVVTLPMGETLEMSDESCGMGCKKKEKIMSECRVLHLDPCTGVIGIACAIGPEGSDDQIIIGEYYLIPVK